MDITLDINGKKIQATISDADAKVLTEQPTGRWQPNDGEMYWFVVDCGAVSSSSWDNDSFDHFRFEQGNVFETGEEAIKHLKYLKAVARIKQSSNFVPDRTNHGQYKYVVYYNWDDGSFCVDVNSFMQYPVLCYYPTKAAAKQALKDCEQEYKLVFGVE